jgi:hypothetical protein
VVDLLENGYFFANSALLALTDTWTCSLSFMSFPPSGLLALARLKPASRFFFGFLSTILIACQRQTRTRLINPHVIDGFRIVVAMIRRFSRQIPSQSYSAMRPVTQLVKNLN